MIRPDSVLDDGLPTSEVGPWSLQKYRLLDLYNTLFSTGMKHLWDLRVYIDLFSGPGRARVRKTERFVETSPIIALRVPDPFDKYIFCDRDAKDISALRDRVGREFPGIEPSYVIGDCNEVVAKIVEKIPKSSKGKSVLSFCFADPFGIDDLKFRTIPTLSVRSRMDFLAFWLWTWMPIAFSHCTSSRRVWSLTSFSTIRLGVQNGPTPGCGESISGSS